MTIPVLHVMPPEHFQPKNNERGAHDRRPEHYFQWHKCLIPARREPGDQFLHELQLVHHLGEIIAGLGSLSEGEALGIEIGHVDCIAVGIR